MRWAGLLGSTALAAATLLASPRAAHAQTVIHNVAVTAYTLDYMQHAHSFVDYSPNLPRFAEGSPWWRVKLLLMANRRAHALYLLGDDRLHVYPARVGVIGWGACAGLQF
jgi:hypothetical protein